MSSALASRLYGEGLRSEGELDAERVGGSQYRGWSATVARRFEAVLIYSMGGERFTVRGLPQDCLSLLSDALPLQIHYGHLL